MTLLIFSAAKQASLLMAALGVTAFGLFGMVAAVISTLAGYRETRGQASYLRSWITGQMAMEWFGERVAPED